MDAAITIDEGARTYLRTTLGVTDELLSKLSNFLFFGNS